MMSNKKQSTKQEPPPTVITLTLPTPQDGGISWERAIATLLIQRGDLAHVRQFRYILLQDLTDAILTACEAIGLLEDDPPIVPEAPAEKSKSLPKLKPQQKPVIEAEPTIDIPLNKGTMAVKISHLKIVGGENDAAAYRQAVLIAGKLIDGNLWDGQSPIRINDVYTTIKKMKHLSEREMSLFTLEDFVQVDGGTEGPETVIDIEPQMVDKENDNPDAQPFVMISSLFQHKPSRTNGHHPDSDAAD